MSQKPQIPPEMVIDENLKKVFEATLQEEVPDRFRKLLEELRSNKEEVDQK